MSIKRLIEKFFILDFILGRNILSSTVTETVYLFWWRKSLFFEIKYGRHMRTPVTLMFNDNLGEELSVL